jgi:hypothetical protein
MRRHSVAHKFCSTPRHLDFPTVWVMAVINLDVILWIISIGLARMRKLLDSMINTISDGALTAYTFRGSVMLAKTNARITSGDTGIKGLQAVPNGQGASEMVFGSELKEALTTPGELHRHNRFRNVVNPQNRTLNREQERCIRSSTLNIDATEIMRR